MRTRVLARVIVIGACALLAMPVGASGWNHSEEIDRTLPLAADGRISLENINGDVTVAVWDRDEVRVLAVKQASSAEALAGLEVEIRGDDDRIRIDTRYPSSQRSWGRHDKSRVEFTLTVPRGATLDGFELVNGNLVVDGLEGEIEAEAVNGNIELRDLAGSAEATTVNGGLEVWATRAPVGAQLDLTSVNGSIDLHLASSVGATVDAETVNGRLENDFGLPVERGKYVGADMRGTIGGGGVEVNLETVNGRIRLHAD